MDFMQGRGGCYEEVEEVEMTGGDIGSKLPSASSSSSPSSSQYQLGHHVFGGSSSPWGGDRAVYYDRESLNFHQSIEFNNLRSNQKNTNDEGIQGEAPPRGSGSGSGGGGDDQAVCIEREHMFDKVVTPSDVGKLNRLVIPKQHAEKYFPLDSSANEKGLLLSFEDRSGKPWRFRYSYWNSSQSYVMTKGWSRFVKEKKLYAGDIVSFERGAGESGKDRLYIDWRRRADVQDHHHQRAPLPSLPVPYPLSLPRTVPWGRLVYPPTMNYDHSSHLRRTNYDQGGASAAAYGYNYNVVNPGSGSVIYLSSPASQQQFGMVQHGGGGDVPMVFDSVPIVHGNKAASKRLRLFGVNLECPTSEEDLECDTPTSMPNPTIGSIYPQLPQLPSPPLQLRLFNGAPSPRAQSSSPTNTKQSMSLDLDI